MPAPKNNTYWKNRTRHGKKRTFKTPKELEKAWNQYFEWVDKHPWYRNEAVKSGPSAGKIIQVPTKRPYTEMGFCAFHGLGINYIRQLEKQLEGKEDKKSNDYSLVLNWARNICTADKFEGATVGAYNANIIARDLGLKENQSLEHSGPGGTPLPAPQVNVYTSAPPLASSEDQIET